VAVVVAVSSLTAYVAVRANLRGDVDDSLRGRDIGSLDSLFGRRGGPFGGPPRPREPTLYAQVVFADGRIERPEQGGITLQSDPRVLAVARGTERDYLSDQEADGSHLRVYTRRIAEGVAIQIARPLDEVDSLLSRLGIVLVIVSGVGIAAGGVLAWFISGRALRPVTRFTERTEAIAGAPDVSARLDASGSDELGRLAGSFNSTLDALERSVESQRQLVADASHELRTPLSSLRTNIEVLMREDANGLSPVDREELLRDLVTQADELTGLVGDVVDVARRGESDADFQEVNLHELVDGVLVRARRLAPQADIVDEMSPWVVNGAPERLTRLVTNLVDNAIKWSPAGKRIEVRLTDGELTVRDFGPGIPPDDLPHVFDRFYRATAARSLPGSGLGLAIVRQVAESHGATALAENADGGGALFRVRFPAAE
jgi:two-component system, OmpR family, sensor histidine kinase MprB